MILDKLRDVALREPCEAVLFSGGVDSTAVAYVHAPGRPLLINVQLLGGGGSDVQYAVAAAEALGMPLVVRYVTVEEALGAVAEVVKILRVFNPMEVVNCAAVYIGLLEAKMRGFSRVCTGDGGDELCIGYDFMLRKGVDELASYLRQMRGRWYFCSFDIGKALGVSVKAPFLEIEEFLMSIPLEEKIKCGVGKCLLRLELEKALGGVGRRRKDPIEVGSGFKKLYDVLAARGREVHVDIPVKGAARYLYHLFRNMGLSYARGGARPCPVCGAETDGRYCKMCGWYAGNPA
ncbi:MAG: asparagine synthase C-terminal domain-containing protein [Pyrobaculum sp.]